MGRAHTLLGSRTEFAALTVLWAVAIVRISINAYVIVTTKTYEERLLVAGGIAVTVLALATVIGAGSVNGQIDGGLKSTVSGALGPTWANQFTSLISSTTFVRATQAPRRRPVSRSTTGPGIVPGPVSMCALVLG